MCTKDVVSGGGEAEKGRLPRCPCCCSRSLPACLRGGELEGLAWPPGRSCIWASLSCGLHAAGAGRASPDPPCPRAEHFWTGGRHTRRTLPIYKRRFAFEAVDCVSWAWGRDNAACAEREGAQNRHRHLSRRKRAPRTVMLRGGNGGTNEPARPRGARRCGLALHWPAGRVCMSHLHSPLSCCLLIYPLFARSVC